MSRRCRLCHRPLRDPLWRARGVGRECARRAGLVRSRQCVTVLVWAARAVVPGEGQLSLFDDDNQGVKVICEQCQRPITDAFATDAEVRRHITCPPGRCANCKTVMPYADLERVELADGELWDDPDMLVCHNVFQCQVRTGERDPDDVPADARR